MKIDFQSAVLERSRQIPVVVDFWAAWCAPCRILGPIVEGLAAEAGGRWELVKVDLEAQPELAQAYGVSGIPAVKMFSDGKVVAEFVGALPAAKVRRWLDESLPDPRLARLESITAGWESRGPEIVPELESFVDENPEMPAARLWLALALVGRDPARARELLQGVEAGPDVASLVDLMETDGNLPPRIAPHVKDAQSDLAAHNLEGTLGHLVDLAMIDRDFGNELARRASLALFELLGHDHDLTREYRRRLGMALHS